jgi:hypothetical protein
MWSELLAFVVGAGVALLAQGIGHSLTLRRERRADFVSALDKAVNAYADGERALGEFTHVIERALGEDFMLVSRGTRTTYRSPGLKHKMRRRACARRSSQSVCG